MRHNHTPIIGNKEVCRDSGQVTGCQNCLAWFSTPVACGTPHALGP